MNKEEKQKSYSYLGATEGYFVDKKILSAFEEYDKGNFDGRIDDSEEIEKIEQSAKESIASALSMQINEIRTDEDLDEARYAVETAYEDGDITFDEYEDLLDDLEEVYLDSEYRDADEDELRGLGAFGNEEATEELIKDEKESTDKMPKEACAMEKR